MSKVMTRTHSVLLAATFFLSSLNLALSEDLPNQVRSILKERCYSCHGESGANEGGFNFALNRKRLVKELVVPGSAEESRLFERVSNGEMPPDGDRLPKQELETIQKWIEAGAANFAAEVEREFISPSDVHAAMLADLEKAADRDRPFMRYFTLTHLYNAGFEDNELESHRRGLSKLLNSLSWGREVRVPVAVDVAKTILRIDLRHYKWNETDAWSKVVDADPYRVYNYDVTGKTCRTLTNCNQPHVRADWFVFAASRPPLYNTILALPDTPEQFVRFEKEKLGVDVARNLRDYNSVLRAGFYPSGVSKSNRLIERHESSYGAYWKSYDFKPVDAAKGNARRSNLKANPTGPDDEYGFEHDGGEMIFNLPNGLQAYMLTDAKGQQIPKGPTDVVVDKEAVVRGRDPEVVNGVSCMNCHWSGMLKKSDQIRDHVLKQPSAYEAKVVEFVKGVYAERAELDAMFQQDRARFETAVKKCGLPGLTKTEPVATLAFQFNEPLDIELAAAEAGVETKMLIAALKQNPTLARELGSLPLGQAVPRETFVSNFETLVQEISIRRFIENHKGEHLDIDLSLALFEGDEMKIDRVRSAEFALKSARALDPIGMGEAATFYFQGATIAKDLKRADELGKSCLKSLTTLAEKNVMNAQIVLGNLYNLGIGVPKDAEKALGWYRKAAATNARIANLHMAFWYSEHEKNVPRVEMLKWLRKAAEQDSATAQWILGAHQLLGTDVPKNGAVGLELLKNAAEQNLPHAQRELSLIYQAGVFTPKNDAEAFKWMFKAANQNDSYSQYFLGLYFRDGVGTPVDKLQFDYWLRKAEEGSDPRTQLEVGLLYYQKQEYVKALEFFRKADEQDLPAAADWLGALYSNGFGVPADIVEAMKYYRKAAEAGIATAQVNLANIYRDGYGDSIPKDQKEAIKWYRKAAEQNSADGQVRLGVMCLDGLGTEKDPQRAKELFRKAAEQNDANAMVNLGVMYSQGNGVAIDIPEALKLFRKAADLNSPEALRTLGNANLLGPVPENVFKLPRDEAEGLRLLRKAAELNLTDAQFDLGTMYFKGLSGVAKDNTEAMKWFRKAADLGMADAQYWVAGMYRDGDGVQVNMAEALVWFQKAAGQGLAIAQNDLGDMYYYGRGTPESKTDAFKWYEKAASSGNPLGQYNLGHMYSQGLGVTKNLAEAFNWTRKAAEQNYVTAQNALGDIYYVGSGVAKDYVESVKWFRKAADKNHQSAQYSMGYAYAHGQGVEKNAAEARKWLKLALENPVVTSKSVVADCQKELNALE
jgi:TPR repeat protein